MKKVIGLLLLCAMIFTAFTACSTNRTSEEDFKDVIGSQPGDEVNADAEANSEVDLKDMDALYAFVKQEIVNVSRESFNTWEVYYFDITGNGTDEVVLVSTYGVDWYDKMEIIGGGSQYKRIPSEIYLGKNENHCDFRDGFLVVEAHTSGTGEQLGYMSLYSYNGSEIIPVLENLLVWQQVAFPNASFTMQADVDGSLTDFIYTLTKTDDITNQVTIEENAAYTYDQSSRKFTVSPINEECGVVRLSGFKDEIIRETFIVYSDYSAVIIPFYPSDGANYNKLESFPMIDNPDGMILEFAVFGKLEDLTISRYQWDIANNKADVQEEWPLGDVQNTILVLHSNLTTDMSAYLITGRVHTGEGFWEEISFSLDDMRDFDEYEVILVK